MRSRPRASMAALMSVRMTNPSLPTCFASPAAMSPVPPALEVERLLQRREEQPQLLLQRALERLRLGDALAARALAQPPEQRARRFHAAVGHEQRRLEVLVQR